MQLSKQEDTPAGLGIVKEWTACAPSSWIVKAEDLEPLPKDFPLEKTHCEIREDVSVVATRISSALRSLSIESTFCSKNVEAMCQTEDCVRFKVCMFAGGGDDGQPIIVEVQKRYGPSFLFSRTCRVLLNAAKGVAPQSPKPAQSPKTLPPVCNMKCLQGVAAVEATHEDAAAQLHTVTRMLSSERSDERILASENLTCLTDPTKTSASVSRQVSQAFLRDETLRNDVLLSISRTDPLGERYESYIVSDRATYSTLCAFGNALEQLRDDGLAELMVADAWFRVDLVPALLNQIAEESQHNNAYQGTRSLLSLLQGGGSEVAKTVFKAGGTEILSKACDRGVRSHERLKREAKLCLAVLSELEPSD